MPWLSTDDGRHFNTDWIDKDKQIAENKKQADNLSYEDKRKCQIDAIHKWVKEFDKVTDRDREVIEGWIQEESKNNPVTNNLTRGVAMSREEVDRFKEGQSYTEGKLASWSTRAGMAQAHARNNKTDDKPCAVTFRIKNGIKKAAKLGIMQDAKFREGEVVSSKDAKFVISKIKKPKNYDKEGWYTEIWLEEK